SRKTIILFLIICILGTAAQAAWRNGYNYRKQITFTSDTAKIPSTQDNFPALISLSSDPGLAANAQDNGNDIVFTGHDGVTKLDHEIEEFNGATGQIIAHARVPSLSASSVIYMYYGANVNNQQNPSGVWDSYYKMVQHMDQDPSGTSPQMQDSTVNDNNGTSSGGMTSEDKVPGSIGYGLDFDGTDDLISVDPMFTNSLDQLSVETWVKFDSFPLISPSINASAIVNIKDWWQQGKGFSMHYWVNQARLVVMDGVTGNAGTHNAYGGTPTINVWYHFAGTYDGQYIRFYSDGQLIGSTPYTGQVVNPTNNVWIGRDTVNNMKMDGIIDEVRISTKGRSGDWVKASFSNQSTPNAFYSLGNEEALETMVGTPADWQWLSPTENDAIRSGTPADWSWKTFNDDGTEITVPTGSAVEWEWYP
ncbi:MAG: DUF2341 domain-containing protein, partial [Candidatus Margulisiibacteriota bacterium]